MKPIATDGVARSVGHVRKSRKADQLIEMRVGRLTWAGPTNHASDGGRDPHWKGQFWGMSGRLKGIGS